ncbi:hypothetical protein ALC57_05977 [Trachymyrmex cornetzi]|uniref:Uncharacterized protein n=1 Tax=Trachymyrmex cornetzi TaxID=471704 RepID=A0A151J9A1_9HYME|nr:hypothetical protein ALC57_05977 [Trachymyrmex cornetzi]
MRQDNTEDGTFRLTRSRSKKLMKKINEECKNVEFLDDVSYNHRIIQPGELTIQKQQLKHDISVKSFSSTSMESMKISTDNENYLDEENLNVTDCNSKMQEISSKSIKKYNNNNLCTISSVINGRVCNVRSEQFETNQNSKAIFSSIINTDIENKILGNRILPKGTIKFVRGNTSDESLQSNVSNDTNNSTKQVSCINDTFKSTNILTEKDYHMPEIEKSIDILKVSESTSVFNNNINLKNKSIDNNEHRSTIVNKNVDSLEIKNNVHNNINDTDSVTTEKYENFIWNRQKQLNKLNNREKYENILQSDKKCKKISSDENILNTSNLVDVSENCNATRSLVLVNKKEAIKQNRKRIAAEENTIKLDNKKKKLNRTLWLQNNVTHIKLLNPQEFDFPNINTAAESNISEENIPVQKIDLREHLNKKRSKSPKLFENKFNNKTSTESEQIDLNNKNDIITPTNTMKDKKFYKRLSFEEEPTFNKTLCKEIDTQTDSICNNRMHSMLQSASEKTQHLNQIGRSIHENANIQEEHMNSRNEDDDCISLFAESFDTNFCENTVLCEQDKLSKSLHSDLPYIMTASSFNKYMKQNATEFNKEYAKCVEDNIETSNKTNKTDKNEFSNQPAQITHTDCISETRTTSKVTALETKNVKVSKCQGIAKINLKNFLNGYCFSTLRKGTCYKQQLCKFKHENIIKELLNRQLSLKAIVNHLVEYIPIKDSNNLMNILECIEKYIKRGEYWNTVRTLVLRLPPDKQRFKSILTEKIDCSILTANNSHSTVQNFGESLSETIASPDGSMSLSQESLRRDNTVINKSKDHVNIEINGQNYLMQPIEKQDESPLFVRSCCNILRTETKIFYVLVVISDQSSQYYPIDLSRYVDKLMMLSLSKKDSNLITEMANLVLKYTFALSTTTCRALVSTLIHMNENLARQMYNYAEGIGIYPAVKVNT